MGKFGDWLYERKKRRMLANHSNQVHINICNCDDDCCRAPEPDVPFVETVSRITSDERFDGGESGGGGASSSFDDSSSDYNSSSDSSDCSSSCDCGGGCD